MQSSSRSVFALCFPPQFVSYRFRLHHNNKIESTVNTQPLSFSTRQSTVNSQQSTVNNHCLWVYSWLINRIFSLHSKTHSRSQKPGLFIENAVRKRALIWPMLISRGELWRIEVFGRSTKITLRKYCIQQASAKNHTILSNRERV